MKRSRLKHTELIYILSLLLVLFIIILLKKIIIKEGARNKRKKVEESPAQTSTEPPTEPPISNSPSNLDLSRNELDIYINKVSTTSPYQKMLDEDIATLQNYQNMLSQEQDKYSFAIKNGSTSEIINELQQSMIPIEKSIDEYQQKISQDKILILQNP